MMEDELISPTDLLGIMEEQAHQINTEDSLQAFINTIDTYPVAMVDAFSASGIGPVIADLTSPYSDIVMGADASYPVTVGPIEEDEDEDEDFTDEEVEEVRLASINEPVITTRPLTDEEVEYLESQSVVATGVGVDEDMNMDELLAAALDEMDASSVTPIVEEEEIPVTSNVVVYDNLPVNSPTISMNETTSRFSSAIWAEKISTKKVLLAGIGGIGSYVAYLLSRVDINYLYLFDNDTVEAANLSGQMFNMSNIGQAKVSAMVNIMANFSNFYKVSAQSQRFTDRSSSMDIMICGFDNMRARKDFFQVWKNRVLGYQTEGERANCLFIDGRLAAEEYQIFCIKGDDIYNMERYERDFLFTDEEAEATICSYKQTSFMANQIASTMVNLFVNFVANQCEPLFDRDLPFYTSYDGITMYFKTEA